MARIPGPSDVAQTRAGRLPPLQNAGAPGQAFQRLGEIANALYQRRQQAEDVGYMASIASTADPIFTQAFEDQKLGAEADGQDFTRNLDQALNNASKKVFDLSSERGFRPSSQARQEAQARLANLRAGYLSKGIVYENNLRVEKVNKEIDAAIDNYATANLTDPDGAIGRFDNANELISASSAFLDKATINSKRQEAENTLALHTMLGYIDSNPAKVMEILNDPHNRFTQALDAEQVRDLLPAAQQEFRFLNAIVLGREAVDLSESLGQLHAKVDEIDDPKLREKVRAQAEAFWADRKSIKAEEIEKEGYRLGYTVASRSKDLEQIHKRIDNIPDWELREQARAFAEQRYNDLQAIEREKSAQQESLKSDSNRKNTAYLESIKNGFSVKPEERKEVYDLAQRAGTLPLLLEQENRERDLRRIALMPRRDQEEEIKRLATSGTVEGATRAQRARDKMDEIEQMARDDGYTLMVRQGLVTKVELDLNDPKTFLARAMQANAGSQHYGVRTYPFEDIEVSAMVDNLDNQTVDEKLLLANRINAMGPDMANRAWEQMSNKNALMFSYAGAISSDASTLSKAVLKGEEKLRRGNATPIERNLYLTSFDEYVGDVYSGKNRQAVREAALAAYAELHGNDFDENKFEDVLEAITGGIIEINGKKLELPRGVTEKQFEWYVDRFTLKAVEAFGGLRNTNDKRAAELIQESQWWQAEANRYKPVHPTLGPLLKPDGTEMVIEYRPELRYVPPLGRRRR